MRGFLGILFLGLFALIVGSLGYQAGAVATGSTAIAWPHLFGLFFGLFFALPFLFLFGGLFMLAVRGPRHGWGRHWERRWDRMGYGPMGPGGWTDDPRRQWVAEAHRRLHEEEAARSAGSSGGPTGPATPNAGGPTAG